MIRDLLFVDKQIRLVNTGAMLFQWLYILSNLIMIIFFEGTILSKCLKGFTILSFLALNFVINVALYNNARSKERVEFMSGIVEIYDKILKSM